MYQAKCRKNAVMVEVPGHNLAALEKLLQNKPQILLVDDSAMNRMMLTEILGDSYHILEAENGRECMEKLQAEAGNIALVLLDINMPVMDGFEVLKAMNANHTIEDIPVIMISSEDSDATIRRSYELGVSDYVNRPFDARIVYRRVTNTIKLYQKRRQLVRMVSEQIRAREIIRIRWWVYWESYRRVPQRRKRRPCAAYPYHHRNAAPPSVGDPAANTLSLRNSRI